MKIEPITIDRVEYEQVVYYRFGPNKWYGQSTFDGDILFVFNDYDIQELEQAYRRATANWPPEGEQ